MMSCRFWVAVGVECQKHCHPFVQNCYASRREIATHFYTKARNNRIEGRAARGCHEWWCCVTICKISALCQMRENGYLASYSGVLSKPWKRGRRQHISTINEHSRYLLFLSCKSFHWQPPYLRSKKIGKTKKTIFEKNAHGYIVKWVTRADIDRIRHHMSAGSMPTIAVGRKDSSSDFYQITLQAPLKYLKSVH